LALFWPYIDAQRRNSLRISDAYSADQRQNEQVGDAAVDLYGSDADQMQRPHASAAKDQAPEHGPNCRPCWWADTKLTQAPAAVWPAARMTR